MTVISVNERAVSFIRDGPFHFPREACGYADPKITSYTERTAFVAHGQAKLVHVVHRDKPLELIKDLSGQHRDRLVT